MASVTTAPNLVPVGEKPLTLGRSPEAAVYLPHPTVSRSHATLRRVGSDLIEVVDLDSRYGTFVNGSRIRTIRARIGDRIQFGTALIYRVAHDGLRIETCGQGLSLIVQGISVVRGDNRLIVSEVSFGVRPDTFLGILGPSGSGKTTLLNCLASHSQPHSGHVLFDDGRDAGQQRDAFRALLGHVPQDNIVYPTLTVDENLWYAAKLRLGSDKPAGELREAIDQAVERVGLTRHTAKRAQMLSGGQQKRLSVAIELLRRPRLLLLDEPTSGVDPASEANLMEQLRHVASRGTTVVCTTHLMDSLRLLDEVVVLGVQDRVGRLAYAGPPQELLDRFGCRSFADLYERLEAGRFELLRTDISADGAHPDAAQQIPAGEGHGAASTPVRLVDPASGTNRPTAWSRASIRELIIEAIQDSRVKQGRTLAERGLLQVARDRGFLGLLVAQPMVLGALVCLTQFHAWKPVSVYFFTVVLAAVSNLKCNTWSNWYW